MRVYWLLMKAACQKNMQYAWAHMLNNIGSVLFGLIYIALWRAASHGKAVGSFTPDELVAYIAVGQLVLWLTTFIPRDLGVSNHIRTGQIALELLRPIPYFTRTLASGLGEVMYNFAFRTLPMAITFLFLSVLPIHMLNSPYRVLLFFVACGLGSMIGLLIQYLIGISAFWTIETRWARNLYWVFAMFCGGQLLPIHLMPYSIQIILQCLPFQSMISLPVLVWLHKDTGWEWFFSAVWAAILWLTCHWLTIKAVRRLEVQGG
jgi:ABC-2 type transport system permease protein